MNKDKKIEVTCLDWLHFALGIVFCYMMLAGLGMLK